jgi:hypothetical protein
MENIPAKQVVAKWTAAQMETRKEIGSILAQSIADEIDAEIVEDMIKSVTIFVHPEPLPKKGDLVRYRQDPRRRNPDGTRQPWIELNGLCTRAYNHEFSTPGQILFEGGDLKNFDLLPPLHTAHVSLEVIND